MPYNGSGTFNRVYQWLVDQANGVDIRADRTDADSNDIALGLSNCITKDGQQTVTANIPFNTKRITGLGAGVASTDAATLKQTQSNGSNYAVATGTANAIVLTMAPTNTALTDGQSFTFMASNLNTGATTIAVDGLTAYAIITPNGIALAGGEILANSMYEVIYSATNTNFTLVNSSIGGSGKCRTVTATAAIAVNDYIVEATANSFTMTLPTAVGVKGKQYILANSGGGTITIATTSGQTISGAAPGSLVQTQSLSIYSNGANWTQTA